MATTAVTLRPVAQENIEYVERLLRDNDLPAGDVRTTPGEFYVARVEGERVGIGGLERYDRAGLLRSVVVERNARGNGYGAAICDELEEMAAAAGLEVLYLLTTTATSFFLARGYEEVERESAPAAIQRSSQFSDLCPTSADCLRHSL